MVLQRPFQPARGGQQDQHQLRAQGLSTAAGAKAQPAAPVDRPGLAICRFPERRGLAAHGLQLIAELHDCRCDSRLLAESHLAVHTWPEAKTVTIDLYVCNFSQDNSGVARAAWQRLLAEFAPSRLVQRDLERGVPDHAGAPAGICGSD
ncbi:S-adenosylmethionine decarboxylase [Accumulibacter sp.]|uniref:S-adenosylmethionine decarboxylase n=1 Tax=Accumulibacter sp. TaxID=2053492 RepID=UPI002604FD82|nr:S-adenosylmethionine decarboxylase [Accumulibacter sp.]